MRSLVFVFVSLACVGCSGTGSASAGDGRGVGATTSPRAPAPPTAPPIPSSPTTMTPPPAPSPPSGPSLTATHPHAILAFAISRDGSVLATGSECGPEGDFESPTVGLVLWDVPSGTPRAVVPVEGGVGLGDQLRRGLAFSDDGSTLGFNYFTNVVGALDVATASVRLRAAASADDGAPSFVMDARGEHVFVAASDTCPARSLGSVYHTSTGLLDRCLDVAGVSDAWPLAWRGDALHVVAGDALVTVDVPSRAVTRSTPLFAGASRLWAWPSPSGRRVAATVRDGAGITLLDADTHARLYADPALRAVSGFVFSRTETRWAAVQAERARGAPVGGVALFEDDRALGTIPGPLAPMDWQQLADGVPFGFSPDGSEGIVVRPDGALEVWSLSPSPQRVRVVTTVPGANTALFALDDVLVVMGPRVLAFVRARDGTSIARYDFPP